MNGDKLPGSKKKIGETNVIILKGGVRFAVI